MTKRSPYEFDGPVSLAAGAQRTRKKKRRESPSDRDTEANEAWLASVLLPAQQNKTLQPAQRNEVDVRTQPLMMEKREVQAQAHMSVEVLEQKKMLLPYLDKIEYINCQLRQRGLLPTEERSLVKEDRSVVVPNSQAGRKPMVKPPTRVLLDSSRFRLGCCSCDTHGSSRLWCKPTQGNPCCPDNVESIGSFERSR
ncbi:hypothetical protein Pcac1_g11744 [Phytophthora cactorum]|uniref:Uncharacterized protein n=2 Tax=Phytophthora cactorum TaxID=29920 RepID=A0A8T1ACW7_9STRA|nr:hypothetical protein Pcac1_g11744 [Phytophthora cactorum]KAG2847242.1 hypothetical protein PC111_g866 [Phytophthora cactorum]KAG2875278.1 hypothetical protein PC117_g27445 [Phytophthora cactorum]KAG2957293.1 hypothetical protein PC119_g27375 [Phytophthora cactorum]KAG3028166.1 hypothetical protein PC121_g24593 [Phytophthora cactorum]